MASSIVQRIVDYGWRGVNTGGKHSGLLNAMYTAGLREGFDDRVAEVLAAAWGDLGPEPSRAQAQAWLQAQGYQPHRFEPGPLLYLLAHAVPLLHHDDHPADDQAAARFRVSMPQSLQDFVQQRVPGTQRIELCHDQRHIVVRRGWQPLGPGCEAGPDDQRIPFDADGQGPTAADR